MKNIIFLSLIFLTILVLMNCKTNPNTSSETIAQSKKPLNCFNLRPIYTHIELSDSIVSDTTSGFEDVKINLLNKGNAPSISVRVFNFSKEILTYESQKNIFINADCFDYILDPDSFNMGEIYFSTRGNTSKRIGGTNVEFDTTYKKNIFNMGVADVYEYHFETVTLVEQSEFCIIIPERKRESIWDDIEGKVICSQGLEWKKMKDNSFLPLYIRQKRDAKSRVPLIFNGECFVPVVDFLQKIEK
jgi:hypothetical protein